MVADPGQAAELSAALAEPLPYGAVEVLVSTGGDDTIDLFESRSPRVVVLTASLEIGDAKSLIEALREMVPREQVVLVLVGDDTRGPIRTALDAIDMKPDRFVSRPLAAKALRFAVQSGLENVARALGEGEPAMLPESSRMRSPSMPPSGNGAARDDEDVRTTQPMSSRGAAARAPASDTAVGSSPIIMISPRSTLPGTGVTPAHALDVIGDEEDVEISTSDIDDQPVPPRTETSTRGSGARTLERGGTLRRAGNGDASQPAAPAPGAGEAGPTVGRAPTDRGVGIATLPPASGGAIAQPLRARWEALADSIADDDMLDDDDVEIVDDGTAEALPPIEIGPRTKGSTNPEFIPVPPVAPWRPGTTRELREEPELSPPQREPTLIITDPASPSDTPMPSLLTPVPSLATQTPSSGQVPPDPSVTERGPRERWSHPVLLSELIDRSRDSSRELLAHVKDDLAGLGDIDDDIIVGHTRTTPPPNVLRSGQLQQLEDLMEPEPPPELAGASIPSTVTGTGTAVTTQDASHDVPDRLGPGRDFARQLRAKMSQMAQRLFQSDSPAQPAVDLRPRHDHHTEIDLASLGEELVLGGGGVTEIERGQRESQQEHRSVTTSPGSWDTQVRERGLPDHGEIVRGTSDVAIVLARMFAQSFTGRVGFRRDDVEKVVYFDQGRPVFASSNEPGDRMGELLVREGKITAAQYERCQVYVEQSGRRMGEILVDFGYLKRRELLPAVRRHVEDILYSLFGWDHGVYHLTPEVTASAERIRLSRHPASLVLEGIRRKLDRTTLEKLVGSPSTVIEVPDRERLASVVNAGDLAPDERSALAAFDGQADLSQVARTSGIDVADVLPLAWGLCALGLATARRTETDVLEESTALVGETDLAIDRERVRARWQLVTDADYFALLGVRRDATTFEIRRAYQSARRDFAADCFPNDLRRELAAELDDIASVLDEAFRVLRDDRLRLTYLANLIE